MKFSKFFFILFIIVQHGVAQIVPKPAKPEEITGINNNLIEHLNNVDFIGGRYQIYNELRSGEYIHPDAQIHPNAAYYAYSNLFYELEGDRGIVLFRQAYKSITYLNVILDHIPIIFILSFDVLKTAARIRLARAIIYYHLLQIYGPPYNKGNIPAFPAPISTIPISVATSRSIPIDSLHYVYNQVLADLNYAESNLTASADEYGIHKNVAIAFKLRAYLAMGNYPDAIVEGNKLVSLTTPFTSPSGVNHSLEPDISNLFTGSYTGNEFIFTAKPQTGFNISRILYNHFQADKSLYFLKPDGFIADSTFRSSDSRRSFFENKSDGVVLSKFTNPTAFVPVLRYAEVLLNLAEALTMNSSGVDGRAVALLTAVRQRSDPGYTFSLSSKEDVLNAILLERKLELIGEGEITPFLLRHQLPLPARPGFPQVLPTDPNYIWEVPQIEKIHNNAYHR